MGNTAIDEPSYHRSALPIKRGIDIVVAATMLFFLSPVIIVVYCAVRVRLGQPVIFAQQRPGYRGRPFYVYKFRTMTRATHHNSRPLSDYERLGRLGKVIRKLSLDELPQLWNVLKGEMSLVGPRPLLMEYLELYTPEQMRRHDVKPGITGLAQVSGRNSLPWEQRFYLDVWYVDNWSLRLDLKILLLTIRKALRAEDVSANGIATMAKFAGKQEDA